MYGAALQREITELPARAIGIVILRRRRVY